MRFLILLILILGAGGGGLFLTYNSDRQISSLKRDNRLLRSQISKLKDTCSTINTSTENFKLEYLDVTNPAGTIPENSIIRLYPSDDSPALYKTASEMQVDIIQKASVDNLIWCYIILPISTNINSRGWITESSFNELVISNYPSEQ